MTPQGGLLERTHDQSKDLLGAKLRVPPKLEDLPQDFSLAYDKSWILSQKEDSCASHASSLASSFQEGVRLEPIMPWVIARREAGMQPSDWGCSLKDIASAHRNVGAMELSRALLHEGDDGWRQPENWDTFTNRIQAAQHKKGSYLWVERQLGYDQFDAIRATLYQVNTPIVIGMMWPYGEEPIIDDWSEGGFGHAITVVGWKRYPGGKDYLVIANSWGRSSGDDGQFLISRQIINKEVPRFGAFYFEDMPAAEVRELQDKGIKLDDNSFIVLLKRFISLFKTRKMPKTINDQSPREKLLQAARNALGTELTPKDEVEDEVACASSMSALLKKVLPDFPHITGTATLFEHLLQDTRFKKTNLPKPGNIIISPTENSSFHGHVGVFLENEKITSNASATGLWSQNYDIGSWVSRYRAKGHLKIYIFELV